MVAFIVNISLVFHFIAAKLEEKGMIKPVITETNTNTGNVWRVKRGERKSVWGAGG